MFKRTKRIEEKLQDVDARLSMIIGILHEFERKLGLDLMEATYCQTKDELKSVKDIQKSFAKIRDTANKVRFHKDIIT